MTNFQIELKVTELETFKKIVAENFVLKVQIEKMLGAISEGVPCPNAVNLPNYDGADCNGSKCRECWKNALDTISVEEHPDGPLCHPEIADMMQNGTLCIECGKYIGVAVGGPRVCEWCGGHQA